MARDWPVGSFQVQYCLVLESQHWPLTPQCMWAWLLFTGHWLYHPHTDCGHTPSPLMYHPYTLTPLMHHPHTLTPLMYHPHTPTPLMYHPHTVPLARAMSLKVHTILLFRDYQTKLWLWSQLCSLCCPERLIINILKPASTLTWTGPALR